MSLSDFWEDAILKHIFNLAAMAVPTIYVALFKTDPTDADTGTEVGAGLGYARQTGVTWAITGSNVYNNSDIVFGPNTTTDWGTITHFGLYDALSGGNLLAHGQLTSPKTVLVNDTVKFVVGALDVIMD